MPSRNAWTMRAWVALFLLTISGTVRADAMYSVVDLGALAGGGDSYVYGLNNRGDVTFRSFSSGDQLYSDGRLTSISHITRGGRPWVDDLGRVYGDPVEAVSRSGIALRSEDRRLYLQDGSKVSEVLVPGALTYELFSVNDNGEVVGTIGTPSGGSRPFLYSGGIVVDLGHLSEGGRATGINNHGDVVGVDSLYRAGFLYRDGQMIDLATMGGERFSPVAINDRGQMLGSMRTGPSGTGPVHAALLLDGRVIDLNDVVPPTPGLTLISGRAINERGQLAVNGMWNGVPHAFLLTPVPEPSTAVLFSAGLLACLIGAFLQADARRTRAPSATPNSRGHHERSHPPSFPSQPQPVGIAHTDGDRG